MLIGASTYFTTQVIIEEIFSMKERGDAFNSRNEKKESQKNKEV